MKKIFDWVFGAFFRTMGRFFFFIGMGFLVVYIISHNDINIPWTDLLGIEMVKADTTSAMYIPLYDSSGNTLSNIPGGPDVPGYDRTVSQDWYAETLYYYTTDNQTYISLPSNASSFKINIYAWNKYPNSISQFFYYQGQIEHSVENMISNSFYVTAEIWINGGYDLAACNLIGSAENGQTKMYSLDCPLPSGTQGLSSLRLKYNIQNPSFNQTGNTWYSWGISPYVNFTISQDSQIIDNNNQNTQEIIQAQENATQQYIQAQENSTQQQIESQQVCTHIDKNNVKTSGLLNNSGTIVSNDNYGITDYINVVNAKIKIVEPASYGIYTCFYNVNKTLISCVSQQNETEITIPNNTTYARFSLNVLYNKPQFEICQNGNQAMSNYLQDSEVSNSTLSGLLDLQTTTYSFGPFATFLNLPLEWIQVILTSNQSCIDIQLPMPFVDNRYITLPCMTAFWQSLGALGTLVQLCWVAVVGVRIFNGLFMLVVDTTSSSDNIEELYKIRSWEL